MEKLMELQLSERLKKLAGFLPAECRLADIGSDHAYLPVYAVQNKGVSFAIAGEVNDGPYQSALQTVEDYNLANRIQVRKGNGLEVIERGEVNVITIAGMGGSLIQSILQTGIEKLTHDITLILQPNVGAYGLRKWLSNHQWIITDEAILEEDGHIYEMMKAEVHYESVHLTEEEALMGPYLLQESHQSVFQKKWHGEAAKIKNILIELDKSSATEEMMLKREVFQNQLTIIERNL